jgi:hypothetical protein
MKRRSGHQDAAVLVFAVLLLAAGVFVLTGVAQISATQALVGQGEWDALRKRVMLENSRSMARQFMMARMFNGVVSNTVSFFDPALGGFTLSPVSDTNAGADYWTTLSTTNTNVNLKINPFTLMERGGFYRVVVPGQVADVINSGRTNLVDWNFQVRTRSPVTAGYPVVQHLPNNDDVVSLAGTAPYIDMNENEQFIGFHEMARMRVSSVTNTNVDTNGYMGYLDVPIGVAASGFFTNRQIVPADAAVTALNVLLDLSTADPSDLSQVLRYELDLDTADYSTNGTNYTGLPVTGLVLRGTEIYNLKPLQVVIPAARTNLTNLYIESRNPLVTGRPVYVNYQRDPVSRGVLNVLAPSATGNWRLGLTVQHGDISFATGGVDIVGGVRTDGSISGAPSLEPERDPGGLDYIADRMMWLEDYKTP